MITQDLGIATAYGYAKSKGYTGTEAEFAELMASYASTAQTAIEAADRAVGANTAAQSAKTDAQASKTAAQTAAQTATSKASEAVTAAGTATTKASEANQSASTASAAATSASTSAQTATTAATTATAKASEASESATTATTAKTDAEAARDAATQSASEAAASAESIDPDEFNRKIYAAFATDIASGSIASFADGADNIPMKDVLVHIEPVQEGSGDPSPDNVRPITGWTGAKVTRTGKNLCDPSKINTLSSNYIWFYKEDGFVFKSGVTYAFSVGKDVSSIRIVDYNNNNVILAQADVSKRYVIYSPVSDVVGVIRLWAPELTIEGLNPQLELGSTATDYEPYSGQTYNITFPTEAGTVYGGTLDVTSGVLTVDRAMVNLGSWNWTMTSISQGNLFRTPSIVNAVLQYDGLNIICSNYPTVKASQWQDKTMSIGSDNRVDIIDSNYSDASAFKTAMNGVQLVYELASPITYTLTPQEITSLLGTNNLWADTGDSDVEYRADTNLYITKKITEAVSALS